MLCVRIDGREVETMPVVLARMVLDGMVDRRSPSRTSSGTSEQSLEQSLGVAYCEALTGELLQRIRSLYMPESSVVDVHELRIRVEDLCRWRWPSPHIAARFFWTAAWLNELTDRFESAMGYYDAFLQTASREGHLRLLAYNNRGVLRIRLGRLEGVQDLARVALRVDLDGAGPTPTGLPAACFNVLNLINVALGSDSLVQAVDEELADFFSQLSEEVRTFWLGPEPDEDNREWRADRLSHAGRPDRNLSVLWDPTYRRLNMATTRLAAQARRLTAAEAPQTAKRLSWAGSQLCLWECRYNDSGSGKDGDIETPDHHVLGGHDRYAEAASLLLSDDVPTCLMRLESPLCQAERFAEEELADIESRLALNHYELAKSRLQVQRRILSSLNRRGRFAGLLARMDVQLERIARMEAQSAQFDFQRACARLVSAVEQFCRTTDPDQADREFPDLARRLRHFRDQTSSPAGAEVADLLEELTSRVERHLRRLRRLEIRRRIRGPLRHLRQNWPTDRARPVCESVYQALLQCHLNDPEGSIEDWCALRSQLDAHQGQYYLQSALAVLQRDTVAWNQVEDDLAAALSLKPDLWLTVAPLFGLFCSPASPESAETAVETRAGVQATAIRLFGKMAQEADNASGGPGRDPMHQMGRLLGLVFRRIGADTSRLVRLWECVQATLLSGLAAGDADAIAEAKALAEKFLDHWPAGQTHVPGRADPRNPINLFLESCDTARRLTEAEQLLSARPPQLEQARRYYTDVLKAGLDRGEQLRRVVTGLYLAEWRQHDSLQVQRHVLDRLEAWVEAMSQEQSKRIRELDVVEEIEETRAALFAGQPVSGTGSARPGGLAEDKIKHTSKVGGFGNTKDGPGKDRDNPQEKHNLPERQS